MILVAENQCSMSGNEHRSRLIFHDNIDGVALAIDANEMIARVDSPQLMDNLTGPSKMKTSS